jgi:protein SCO1/2
VRRWLPLLVAAALAGCGGAKHADVQHPASRFRTAAHLPPGTTKEKAPRMRLRDARGGVLDTATIRTPYLVTFLYTKCPDVCPLIGEEIKGALGALGQEAQRLTVVAVSVDPKNDTPAAVRRWLRLHHEPRNFHYLVGTAGDLRPVWKSWHILAQAPGSRQSVHSALIWLIDRSGHQAALVPAGVPIKVSDLAADLRTLIRG